MQERQVQCWMSLQTRTVTHVPRTINSLQIFIILNKEKELILKALSGNGRMLQGSPAGLGITKGI